MFGAYGGYVITFDGESSVNFGTDCARNVVIFVVDNSTSSHAENCRNEFLVIVEGLTYGIDGSFCSPDKKFSINLSKARINILYEFTLQSRQ